MIGVIPRPDQLAAVEEFFELFKTPWELYQPDRRYDVIVATADQVPEVETRLLLVFGSGSKNVDVPHTEAPAPCRTGACVDYLGSSVPIFGSLLTFESSALPAAVYTSDRQVAGVRLGSAQRPVLRLGYDLFDEVQSLLSSGQPLQHAHVPTLDLHIAMLRGWMLNAGIAFVEVAPVPAGHAFSICLTHDIDFVGIRDHLFDHSMLGFLYRSTAGALRPLIRGRITVGRLLRMWRAVASLPFVLLGWARDFWEPFEWYLRVEEHLPATYYVIPFKRRQGDRMPGRPDARRATAYDVADVASSLTRLTQAGCEVGVHGIDAWHDVEKAQQECARVTTVTGVPATGIRIHWLLRDAATPDVLDRAGYAYDSTSGYNETVGFRNGTAQVFRPLGVKQLLELPMHIQDGALFFPDRLDLSEPEAWERCAPVIDHVRKAGGVLTVLWHDRSHGPERFWGEFYIRLVGALKSSGAWFGTGMAVVEWFRKRRAVRFDSAAGQDGTRTTVSYPGTGGIRPPLTLRFHYPAPARGEGQAPATTRTVDVPWDGTTALALSADGVTAVQRSATNVSESYSIQ